MRRKQKEDPFVASSDGQLAFITPRFNFTRDYILVRRSPMNEALQNVVHSSLKSKVLIIFQTPVFAGHPGGSRMSETVRRYFYWGTMATDIFKVASDFQSCARVRGSRARAKKFPKMFPAAGPLESISMDFCGTLRQTMSGHTYILVITYRFSKVARAVRRKLRTPS